MSMSLAERILEHLNAHKEEESKRDMSGLMAAFGETERPSQIRLLLDQLVRGGRAERYSNGKRHCWRSLDAQIMGETPIDLCTCRHGVRFNKYCAKCEDEIHGQPANQKLRRG